MPRNPRIIQLLKMNPFTLTEADFIEYEALIQKENSFEAKVQEVKRDFKQLDLFETEED